MVDAPLYAVYALMYCTVRLQIRVALMWTQNGAHKKKKRIHEEERRWWCQSFGDGAFRPGYKLGAQNALPASQHQSVRLFCCFQVNRLCLSLYGDSSRDFNTSWECVVQWKFQLEIIYFYYYYFFFKKR